ncbi:hypothetical protein I3843_10G124500 [Carya illinoinensis]|uniref:Uncharacterized protein n=1 Tax=Carya illinoinensis TaxID=32201 RepID=A0A922DXI7_CARIL|nr:uncharacterized protein LOC122279181 isoform X1 [Carya illinoinensis]XP_042945517.1 uncharacterized protein LOC122279181 isoform X1 [Carya illinoinensis]KAG6692762.1 hypothetical protein I3842_10G131100 [Carya illinoinensis]KAG6692763.1 hypothetical protein I3842_10G131100 [Carya illinoinensis]KAG6692764.1 hypothetical protein I3842_10G131100 [Carya illinoinensis]KAG7960454.1 hypothetical protein I3843_10G124500 [Carya illinoinensis]KAG7960455.1 hypothetical protein I3843_10G124500 [Carya 
MEKEALHKKVANVECQKVKKDESCVSALEDEAIEVEHLLAEPKNEHVSVDGVLSFGEESLEKCFQIEDFSCGFGFGLALNNGCLDSNTTQEGEDLQLEVLDGLLDELDEVDDLDATNGLSGACDCEDFLLDIEFAEKKLDSGPSEATCLGNSSSESPSPGLSGSCNGAVGISESSTATILESECKNDVLDKIVTCKLHGGFMSKCGCQPPAEDGIHMASIELRKLNDLDHDENLLACGILSTGTGKRSLEVSRIDEFLREKRLRKPTRRYIEESSSKKSGYLKGREKYPVASTKDTSLKVKSCNELHNTGRRASTVIHEEKSLCGIRVRRGRPKKLVPQSGLDSDKEPLSSESEDNCATKKKSKHDRRKHQRMWTPSEVIKLVDGISEYGVGRWTDIKRLLFSTSAYRTPIDLRDKWRNLLRASGAEKPNKKGVEQKQEHSLRPLPSSLLRRVRELAKIHPYPRVRISKKSCIGQVVPAMHPGACKGAPPSSLSGRSVRRKNIT